MRDKDGIAITEERCCIKDRHGRAKHFCGWTCYNAYKKEEGKA